MYPAALLRLLVLVAALLACACFAIPPVLAEGRLNVIATTFPIYDWVREIAGDELSRIDLTLLLDNGVDLHSFQTTAQDVMKIAICDVFFYVGGESDDWVDDALQESVNPGMISLSLLDAMGGDVKTEEIVEGMEHEHDEEREH